MNNEGAVPRENVGSIEEQIQADLDQKVGIEVDYSTLKAPNLVKFIIFSAIGIFVFFIPIGGSVPMVLLINAVKALLGSTVMK